ncbi:hypothetical protein PEL8287_03723 [Roseovarius litorisediminis]|uniref:Uncharacterized protein n=1 Tax=Roseovarius litorisediminis TaxID=1312363 RepID=A0A1Y5TM94_9RHOB|nr:hypothetical protein [Roseovarius litorisediminis]SLN67386.1 hypothetical protein PEL8287_03723 [Roseovarius litorisediminis]
MDHANTGGLSDRQNALTEMQAKLADQDMAPLSTAVLGGQKCTALSLLIRDAYGGIATMGFVGMLQNRFSPLADFGWIGVMPPTRRSVARD